MSDEVMDPIRRHQEGLNRHDPVAFAAPFSAEATNHGRKVGRESVQRVAESLLAAFPDLRWEMESAVVQGDTVMCEVTMTGTHLGSPSLPVLSGHLVGVPPTGRAVRQHQMHLYRVAGGEISEHRAIRDDLGLLEQLGLIEAAAQDISRRK